MNKTYTIIKTSRFKRDYKRLMRQGRDMTDLDAAIGKLANAFILQLIRTGSHQELGIGEK